MDLEALDNENYSVCLISRDMNIVTILSAWLQVYTAFDLATDFRVHGSLSCSLFFLISHHTDHPPKVVA